MRRASLERRGRFLSLLAAMAALAVAPATAQVRPKPGVAQGAPAPAPAPVSAALVLDTALDLLRKNHINSASADWDRLGAEAHRRIAGATRASDAHDAIRYVIAALGERHTFLHAGPLPNRPGAAPRSDLPMPATELAGDRFGLVRVPGFLGTPDEARRYTAALREGLTALDRDNICGWIVDLRGNTGGNMWPMLNGLDPLLGPDPFGYFRPPTGAPRAWVRGGSEIAVGPSASRAPAFSLAHALAPVAVLLGPRTGSSGEMTAMAFVGRAGARTFGAPTAGYTSANSIFPLPDESVLVITTAYVRDRTGREYRGPMVPDEAADDAQAAALRWLAAQPCR